VSVCNRFRAHPLLFDRLQTISYSFPHFALIYVQCNIQGQKLDPRCEINKHIFVFTKQLYIFILVVYNNVHQIFLITVRLLQNNERGFPLIFTITVVEFAILYP
jgi:hypothetical protein